MLRAVAALSAAISYSNVFEIGKRRTARCKLPRSFASMNSIVEEEVDSCAVVRVTSNTLDPFALYPKLNDAVHAQHHQGIRGCSASDR